jgi:16S rRNA (cytidine1402-2'-O)-methyltransferase
VSEGTLFVVATPIGNLDDLSPRARDILAAADLVAAEDTRVTGRLLSHFGIKAKQVAFHDHNEESKSASLIEALKSGKTLAIVSDAGTPLISDPGYRLIRLAHAAGITVSPIPGPSAALAALSASGLPTDRFAFEGFLPSKPTARRQRLAALAKAAHTMVFFESVHRIAATLSDMVRTFGGDRDAFVGRELTKRHEQCVAADLASLSGMLDDGGIPAKGEFVLVVGGAAEVAGEEGLRRGTALLGELLAVMPGRQAVDIVARVFGGGRNEWYQRMLALKAENS